jgi:primase-polymerase (primpol)-like protein
VRGAYASSTDSYSWASYSAAKSSVVGDGLGFVLGDGIACLDLDGCLVDGKPNALAMKVLAETTGYVEVSPSGRGLHVWGLAPEMKGCRRDGIEAYSVGRYITVTGDVFRHGRLADITRYFV